jgi:DNA-binding PucR family transcriptional regulator
VVSSLAHALLDPIVEHDTRRGAELLDTLTAFLESNGQWQATADVLHIHVNTLRHRIARIEELSGRSLDTIDGRVDLFLALRARGLDGVETG